EWPLSALDGELASGVWSLRVTDRWQHDIGAITAFSLALSTSRYTCDGVDSTPDPASQRMYLPAVGR
ncbi:MAG: hypothetical protein RLZZ387_2008, partial [Chloroflexota bacterium]